MTYQTKTIDGKKYKLVPVDDTPYRLTETFDFEVYYEDLPELTTYVDAVKAVEAMGNGWRIPTRMELQLMYGRKEEIGGFKTKSDSRLVFSQWYWSCTDRLEDPVYVWNSSFWDGDLDWHPKESTRLSCRPVRSTERFVK